MGYTRAQADILADALRSLPAFEATQGFNLQKMVTYLREELFALQERGYSIVNIAAALRAGGMEIAASTLKTYLRRIKPKRRGQRRKGRQATAAAGRSTSRVVN
jgi:hypothetical protein